MKQTIEVSTGMVVEIAPGHELVSKGNGKWAVEPVKPEYGIDWVPEYGEPYHYVNYSGVTKEGLCRDAISDRRLLARHNSYPNDPLAKQAAAISHVQYSINRASLLVDPERGGRFIRGEENWRPEWGDGGDEDKGWFPHNYGYITEGGAMVSEEYKCQEVCDHLNKIGIKPVGVCDAS